MPNALFEPIIGRDFSDVANQRFGWAGFNRAVESENLARAAAAEQSRNNYLAAVAQIQRDDAARQAAMDARAQETALSLDLSREQEAARRRSELEQAARQERQFGEQMKFAREDLAARGEQAGEKLNLLKAQQEAAIDQRGALFATSYGLLKAQKEKADAALETVKERMDNAEAETSTLSTKKKRTEEDIARQMSLTTQLPALRKELRLAESSANALNRAYDRLVGQMTSRNFDINEDTGKIVHEDTGKEWNFRAEVEKAKATPLNPPASASVSPISGTSGADSSRYGWLGALSYAAGQSPALQIGLFGRGTAPAAPISAPVPTFSAPPVPTTAAPRITGRLVRDASGKLVLVP